MALVLIVDDSPVEQHVYSQALEQSGYDTITANDGEEALVIATEKLPDLIIMDVVMPGMNGFQATRKLHKDPSTEAIPVIIISMKNQETDKIWAMRQGAVEYLVKPVKPAALVAAVEAGLQV
ncbi:MAG: response regulator [Gammaproteobacteria bacterium]|nr:response regulator [Gammaproteobacteria bacterium]